MIAYKKTNGIASDLRFVADDYRPASDETLIQGDTLPALDTLSDVASVVKRDESQRLSAEMQVKRTAALDALQKEQILKRAADADAPQAVKDYAAALAAQPVSAAVADAAAIKPG